jgi:hypothetical protein
MRSTKLYIAVNSHLSDALIEMGFNLELAKERIRFVKILTNRYEDLSQEISIEKLNEIWLEMKN